MCIFFSLLRRWCNSVFCVSGTWLRPGFDSRAGIRGTYLGEIRSIRSIHGHPSIGWVGIGASVPTQQQLFCLFHFAGVRASRAYRAAWRVVERKQRQRRQKKTKKSTPSGTRIRRICLEGRSVTLTPMASFFTRAAPMGAQRRELTGQNLSHKYHSAKKPFFGFLSLVRPPQPRVHASSSIFIVH